MSSSGIYLLAVVVFIGAVALAAQLIGVPLILVVTGVIALGGLALLTAIARARPAEPPPAGDPGQPTS
jgi:hypothetical protein